MNTNPSRRNDAYQKGGVSDYARGAAKYRAAAQAGARSSRGLASSGRKRTILTTVCCAALLALCISGVYAWYAQQDSKINTFIKLETTPEIKEEFTEGDLVKKNVYVSIPDGCIPVWVRAQVSVQWQSKDGSVMFDTPELGADYSIEWVLGDAPNQNGMPANWVVGNDGYYYWTVPLVAKNPDTNRTGNLINSVTVLKKYDDERRLVVDIAAQSLEDSADAFNDAWKSSGLTAVPATGDVPAHLTKTAGQSVEAAEEGGSHEAA